MIRSFSVKGFLTTLALATLIPATALAAEEAEQPKPPAGHGLGGTAASSVQLNPTLLKVGAGVHYRHAFSETSSLEGGAGVTGTGSYVSPAVHAEMRFVKSFALRAEYAFIGYTAASRGLLEVDSTKADTSESALERMEARAGSSQRFTLTPHGELRLGPALLKMENAISYMHTHEQGVAFYVPDYDTIVRRNDVLLASRTDLLFAPWRDVGLAFGPSLQSTWAIRTSRMRSRAGATIGFTPAEEVAFLRRPTVAFDAGINVTDEHRAGQAYATVALSTAF